MESLSILCSKDRLDTSDVLSLLRCLQEESTPFLTSHTSTPGSKQVITSTPSRNKPNRHLHNSKRSSPNTSTSPSPVDQRKCRGTRYKDTKKSKGRGESPQFGGGAAMKEQPVVSLDLSNPEEFPPMTTSTPKQQ